jgi:hypothetical protein
MLDHFIKILIISDQKHIAKVKESIIFWIKATLNVAEPYPRKKSQHFFAGD